MKFFIDTASLEEIERAQEMGVLDGVTTNPSLVAKITGGSQITYDQFKAHIKKICEIVDGPVSAEVTTLKAEEMIVEGEELASIDGNVVIKVPITQEGIRAIKHFSSQGIKTNATLAFSSSQALLAAKAGATYVSPFVGRLDDISHDGMGLIEQIVQIYQNYNIASEIIVASIRHPIHVTEAAMLGADIATIPYSVIKQLVKHPLTDIGLERFMKDSEVIQKAVNA